MEVKFIIFLLIGQLCLTIALPGVDKIEDDDYDYSTTDTDDATVETTRFDTTINAETTIYIESTTNFIETTTTSNNFCYSHGVTCTKSSQCCNDDKLLCFAQSKPSGGHYEHGKCLCDRGYYWEHKTNKCTMYEGPSSVLTIVYIVFASLSLVMGIAMLFFACRSGCTKNQRTQGHNAPQRILVVSRNGRTRVPVIPIVDNPPKYHDLDTVCKTLPSKDMPPPAYHDSMCISNTHQTAAASPPVTSLSPPVTSQTTEVTSQVPAHTGFDHYGFYKSVQGWLKNEPASNQTSAAGTDNPSFSAA